MDVCVCVDVCKQGLKRERGGIAAGQIMHSVCMYVPTYRHTYIYMYIHTYMDPYRWMDGGREGGREGGRGIQMRPARTRYGWAGRQAGSQHSQGPAPMGRQRGGLPHPGAGWWAGWMR